MSTMSLLAEATLDEIIEELERRYVAGTVVVKGRSRTPADGEFMPARIKYFGDIEFCVGLADRSSAYLHELVAASDDLFGDTPDRET